MINFLYKIGKFFNNHEILERYIIFTFYFFTITVVWRILEEHFLGKVLPNSTDTWIVIYISAGLALLTQKFI